MVARAGGGVAPALTPEQLLAAVPGLADTGIDVDVVDFRQVPGASVSLADLDLLAREIEIRFAGGTDGVVITQGPTFFSRLDHRSVVPAGDRPTKVGLAAWPASLSVHGGHRGPDLPR